MCGRREHVVWTGEHVVWTGEHVVWMGEHVVWTEGAYYTNLCSVHQCLKHLHRVTMDAALCGHI